MKLDKLKDYIPKVDDKSNEIYQEANKKNNRFRFVFSIKIVSLATLCLIVLIGIILLPKWRNNTIEENVEVDYTDETVMLKSAALNLDFTKYNVCKEYEINPEVDIFLEKLEDFSHKISVEIYDGTDENYLVSPVSIYMALAMVIECTNGETREEVLNAVGVTYDEVINFTKYIYGLANRKYYDKNNKLSAFEELANSIWIEESIDLKKVCLDILSEYYHVDSLHVPFKNNTVYANDLLKKYVHDKTYGLINLELEIPPSTLFLLVNTYYIKDNWLYNGSELNFTDRIYDFKNVDGSITSTKLLMGEYTPGQIYESDKFYHFTQKSYKGYKMKIILPKDDYTVDDIYSYDISSSYPTQQLTHFFPMKKFKFLDLEGRTENKKIEMVFTYIGLGYAVVGQYRFKNIRLKNKREPIPYISLSRCDSRGTDDIDENGIEQILDNGRILQSGFLECCCTEIDLSIILEQYDYSEMTVVKAMVSKKDYLPLAYREVIQSYYNKKTLLKGDDTEDGKYIYMKSKNMLNAVY